MCAHIYQLGGRGRRNSDVIPRRGSSNGREKGVSLLILLLLNTFHLPDPARSNFFSPFSFFFPPFPIPLTTYAPFFGCSCYYWPAS